MQTDAIILAIETSTSVCSVALFKNAELLDYAESFDDNSHSSILTLHIQHIVKACGVDIQSIDAIALSSGPGSYTGLRIGASVAKGLCFANSIKLLAIDTLESLAHHCAAKIDTHSSNRPTSVIVPMIDARRMEVYTAAWNMQLTRLNQNEAKIITEDTIEEFATDTHFYLCGNGSTKCKTLLHAENITYIDNCYTSAKYMGVLAYNAYKANQFEDIAYFEPNYLKEYYTTTPKKIL